MGTLLCNRQTVLNDCGRVLREVISTYDLTTQAARLQDQTMRLAQRIWTLVNENARTQMAEDEFNHEHEKLAARYERLSERIAAIQEKKGDKE